MKQDRPFWMWHHALQLLEEIERLNRRYFQFLRLQGELPIWHPPIDLFEEEGELRLIAVLPNVDPHSLEVLLEGGMVKICGERLPPVTTKTRRIYHMEIPYGYFERRIPLPPGRYRLIESRYDRGCLELRFRKHHSSGSAATS